MTLPIPPSVIYAGLGGTLLALIVATAQQNWKPRVFFLLALRLAIGWQFLFEGMHKIHSHVVGPTETNRPFSSEPYFRASPTWVGRQMLKNYDDPLAVIDDRVKAKEKYEPATFAKLSIAEQAKACPDSVKAELDAMSERAEVAVKKAAERALADAKKALDKATKEAKTDKERLAATDAFTKAQKEAETALASSKAAADELVTAAKASYARWVYGAEGRPAKTKFFTGDPALTAPQRLEYLEWVRKQNEIADTNRAKGLGNAYGIESKRAADARTDLFAAESALAADAKLFVDELKRDLNGGRPVDDAVAAAADLASDDPEFRAEAENYLKEKLPAADLEALRAAAKDLKDSGSPDWQKRLDAWFTVNKLVKEASPKKGERMDAMTSYFIAAIGACIFVGLFTRLSCVLAAGFLLTTYLVHPPFPWYPNPPGTEGNPLFVNKNLIEIFALLALACLPTGRWLGLDALIAKVVGAKPVEKV